MDIDMRMDMNIDKDKGMGMGTDMDMDNDLSTWLVCFSVNVTGLNLSKCSKP